MSLILRPPWNRQPQQPLGIDRAHPLARNLRLAFSPQAAGLDATGFATLTHDSTELIEPLANDLGLGRRYTRNGNTAADTAVTLQTWAPSGVGWTVAGIGQYLGGVSTAIFFGDWANFGCFLTLDSGNALRLYLGGTLRLTSSVTLSANDTFRFIAWGQDFANDFLWVNGTTDSVVDGGWGNFSAATNIGGGSNFYGAQDIRLAQILAWDRQLSEIERNMWIANPWQVRQPLRRRIWVAAPASIPVLSAATVTSITSTGATPRVTITF